MDKKIANYFRNHQWPLVTKSTDDYFWNFIKRSGFWTERDHKSKTMYIFFPESHRNVRKQKLDKLPLKAYDWFFNFLFIPFFGIHLGFLLQFIGLKKELKRRVKAFKPKKVVIITYSQGSGSGQLSGFYLKSLLKINEVEGYSYGPPRVFGLFWHLLIPKLKVKWTIIINGNDVVPKIPFAILGYKHYGKIIKIGQKRHFLIPKVFFLISFSFRDHLRASYHKSLGNTDMPEKYWLS